MLQQISMEGSTLPAGAPAVHAIKVYITVVLPGRQPVRTLKCAIGSMPWTEVEGEYSGSGDVISTQVLP